MIKAIETRYKGYRFRSRLEARWAVYFDSLGLEWEYEPEGFHLSDGRMYLPDFKVFKIHGGVIWCEIKPTKSSDDGKMCVFRDDMVEAGNLTYANPEDPESQDSFRVLSGDPIEFLGEDPELKVCPRCGDFCPDPGTSKWSVYVFGRRDERLGYPCWPCDVSTPGGGDHDLEPGLKGVKVRPHKGCVEIEGIHSMGHSVEVRHAANKARSARFEHGESP